MIRGLRLAVALACLLPMACASATPAPVAAQAPAKKRGPPPPPPAVTAGGTRYAAVPRARDRGLDQAGGWLAAIDIASGRELWLVKLYETGTDPDMETDKQDVFIRDLRLVDGRRALVATDERDRRFRVDLATRAVTALR